MASVNLSNLNKIYGEKSKTPVHILHDVNLDITDGEFVVFVGPSGCGKSTLLRCIAGLEEISSGDLNIAGERVNDHTPKERGIGMVFQSYALYPHMSVYHNMAFGLELSGMPKDEIRSRVTEVAKTLQLDHLLDRKPKALSGGQRQRVAIGRAIVREPKVFLFDEPLSNLDAALRVQMRIEIARLHGTLKNTMIYVTHDQIEAMTLADKIVVLSAGRIEQVGAPLELYHRPANRFVAGFIGSPKMNFLEVSVDAVEKNQITISLDGHSLTLERQTDAFACDKAALGIRPEHLTVDGSGDLFIESTVSHVEHLGDQCMIYMDLEGLESPVVVVADGDVTAKSGQTLTLGIPVERCHLFDQNDQRVLPVE
ncbi:MULTISPECIES: sn-glycerol-3-phosphate ABC transporter ATP-binding protein UgpC [unclassified Marinobacterium]|uniref:ABC transporter ATP-binding protein n=1 Tax=unclassified Marinobacterium TaxID=2644139 RepID=UPI001569DDA2|nr:Maltose/maltodextrin import ATP-binding protein MalK [Marinobacterium sp. xm-g-48]NRP83032.1 Maltose/maltodextrin import ATP-binding protein MalK [Marinobacterium sp. xm-d-509]